MASNDLDDAWIAVENTSETRSNAAADAAMLSLSQNKPRQALHEILKAKEWLSLRTLAKANARLKDIVKLPMQGYEYMDHAKFSEVEERLALEDSEVSASIPAEVSDTAGKGELEQYSVATTQALHAIFHEKAFLPCNCHDKRGRFYIFETYVCALRLDGKWEVTGDDSHCFFDSVLAIDERHEWRHIQFQLPRVYKQVRFQESTDETETATSTPKLEHLDDFCQFIKSHVPYLSTPIRIENGPSASNLYELTPIIVGDCPEHRAPVPLAKAFREDLLSAKSKIHLAFTLSKSFWQYYESDWMHATWSFDTIHLLPQRTDFRTLNSEAKAPFLTIDATAAIDPFLQEHEPMEPSSKKKRLHQYPYILNLCFLLVLLCTEHDPNDKVPNTIHDMYLFCVKKLQHQHSNWPLIDLPDSFRQEYKRIVVGCHPKPCQKIRLSLAERRAMLRDEVVRPLYDLLQNMQGPDADDLPVTQLGPTQSHLQTSTSMDEIQNVPRKASTEWVERLTTSVLYKRVTLKLRSVPRDSTAVRRPRIVIIDTGYDPTASFIGNSQRNQLSLHQFKEGHEQYHWKDFWGARPEPLDSDGHGTAMLSVIMRIAPFANICVARIAGSDHDLGGQHSGASQKNLAEAISWAVDTHRADIISMSLGWEQEHRFEDRYVVRNAISNAMTTRDQKVLFFAAASNFGGGKHELFPARHPQVVSVRATDDFGKHPTFNSSLPEETGVKVYGTLGVGVPTAQRGSSEEDVGRTGTSPATAVAAGIAALIIGYINAYGEGRSWDNIRTQDGFQRLLPSISTEPEARKRFITLENVFNSPESFETMLNNAHWASRSH